RDDGHFHAANAIDFVVFDFWEDHLLFDTKRVVATAVERLRRHAREVADPRQCRVDQLIEESVHVLAAQRHHRADSSALSQLERGDRLLRAGHDRSLTGDRREVLRCRLNGAIVLDRFAQTDVDDDFLDPWYLHRIRVAEFTHHRRHDVLAIDVPQAFLHLYSHALYPLPLHRRGGNDFPAVLANARLALDAFVFEKSMSDSRRAIAGRADQHHIGHVDGSFFLDDAGLNDARARLGVALHLVQSADHHPFFLTKDAADLSGLSTLSPRDNQDGVSRSNVHDLEHLRSERNDLHKVSLAQLAG